MKLLVIRNARGGIAGVTPVVYPDEAAPDGRPTIARPLAGPMQTLIEIEVPDGFMPGPEADAGAREKFLQELAAMLPKPRTGRKA